jgi:hypothetical protein
LLSRWKRNEEVVMNLYLIERTDEWDWDEYDSGVVAAETEADIAWWPNDVASVCTATLIGVAQDSTVSGGAAPRSAHRVPVVLLASASERMRWVNITPAPARRQGTEPAAARLGEAGD